MGSSMLELMHQGVALERAGKSATELVKDVTPGGEDASNGTMAYASEGMNDEDSVSVNTNDPDVQREATEEAEPAASESKPKEEVTGDKEVITVTDNKGKRQITVDFNDRAKVKKAFELAAGARKWQAERDTAAKKATELETKLSDLQRRWDLLEGAWREEAEDGVIKLLSDGKRNVDTVYKERAEREAQKLSASPAELAKMEFEERLATEQKARQKIEKEMESFKESITKDKTAAEEKVRESVVNPAFDKYRFDGKLGNDEQELMLDEMMWTRAGKALDEYSAQGIPLTPALVEREFKKMQVALASMVKAKVDKQVTETLEKKKVAATESAQRKVTQGFKRGKDEEEGRNLLASGDIRGFFSNFGKYTKK